MKNERRTMRSDEALGLRAYRFEGIMQPFPSHFHGYYVLGLMEAGQRRLECRGVKYSIGPGDVLIFNPGDSHACVQSEGALDFRGLEIPIDTMMRWLEKSRQEPLRFSDCVVRDEDISSMLRQLHMMIFENRCVFEREEHLILLLTRLADLSTQPLEKCPVCASSIETACAFMERHLSEHMDLEQIGRAAGMSKSTLLRGFTREKGMTPWRYLEALRVNAARRLLEQDMPPVEAALCSGFSDQSHFTHSFSRLIGLTPGMYRNFAAVESRAISNHQMTEEKSDGE